MRIGFLIFVLALGGCGAVKDNALANGGACSTNSGCTSGTCADGVCCDRACDTTCEACTASKTGGADGTCAPVTAATDPDGECTDQGGASCGANGTGCNGSSAAPGCNVYPAATACGMACGATGTAPRACDGSGVCVTDVNAVSCGDYTCTADATGCRTSCTMNSECAGGATCNVNGLCTHGARVALVAGLTSCARTESLPALKTALEAAGDTVTIVQGTDVDTAGELAAFDVVVLVSPGSGCTAPEYDLYDAAVATWVQAGGGLVVSGWFVYVGPPAMMGALTPNSGQSYDTGATALTVVGSHPIVAGVSNFTAQAAYTPYGGSPKAGSIDLLHDGAGNSIAQATTAGMGRVVFAGPLWLDGFAAYMNQSLTDGTNPQALRFFIRAIEWAGKKIN